MGAKGYYGAFVLRTLADFGRVLATERASCETCHSIGWAEHIRRGGD